MSKLRSIKGVMREADVLFDGIELAKGWFEKALTNDRHAIHTLLREIVKELEGDFQSKNPDVNWIKAVPAHTFLTLIDGVFSDKTDTNVPHK